jgi:hypothetical protein
MRWAWTCVVLGACVVAPPAAKGTEDSAPAVDSDLAPEPETDLPETDRPETDVPVDTEPPCAPQGTPDCPIRVPSTPWSDSRDTRLSASDAVDAWACAPETDESGPEVVYAFDAPAVGVLSFTVQSDAGVDVDVHLARSPDAAGCVNRGHLETAWFVQPGRWYLIADTWVDAQGTELAGGYTVFVDFLRLDRGPCAMTPVDLEMFWTGCAPEMDCDDSGPRPVLHTPSLGPTVKEAHLVTEDESFPGGWPTSFTDRIQRHYAVSEGASGYAMARTEPWAPAGEGGSEFGQGAYGAPLPAADEAWYVNMYWRDRPAPGTRMVILNPYTGDAVIAAGGYETGPGDGTPIGGAAEEVHDALASDHLDELLFGFAADAAAPLGPVRCW